MARRFVTDVPEIPAAPSPISDAISGRPAVHEDGYRPGTARAAAGGASERVSPIAAKAGIARGDEAGFARGDIVHIDVAFADLDDSPEVNALHGDLSDPRPARAVHEAAHLPFGGKVEVRATAMRG